jgi:hypothetical protein
LLDDDDGDENERAELDIDSGASLVLSFLMRSSVAVIMSSSCAEKYDSVIECNEG